jgi:hypothetical protein
MMVPLFICEGIETIDELIAFDRTLASQHPVFVRWTTEVDFPGGPVKAGTELDSRGIFSIWTIQGKARPQSPKDLAEQSLVVVLKITEKHRVRLRIQDCVDDNFISFWAEGGSGKLDSVKLSDELLKNFYSQTKLKPYDLRFGPKLVKP